MKNLFYFPGIGNDRIKSIIKNDISFDISFLTKKSPFYYPYFLISYEYGNKIKNLRDMYDMKDGLILGDSGGFTNLTKGKNYNPKNVMEWMNNNVDIGFILDLPTRNMNTNKNPLMYKTIDYDGFVERLNKTKSNIETMMKYKDDVKLYGVLHGYTHSEHDEWNSMLRNFNLDGVSIPAIGMDKYDLIDTTYRYAKEWINIHYLGLSSFSSIPFLSYVSNHNEGLITFDSVSYRISSTNKQFLIPFSNKYIKFGRNSSHLLSGNMCNCPYCRLLDGVEEYYFDGKGAGKVATILSFHNLYWTVQYIDFIYNLSKDVDRLRQYLKDEHKDKALKLLDVAIMYQEEGIEKASKRVNLKSRDMKEWL